MERFNTCTYWLVKKKSELKATTTKFLYLSKNFNLKKPKLIELTLYINQL